MKLKVFEWSIFCFINTQHFHTQQILIMLLGADHLTVFLRNWIKYILYHQQKLNKVYSVENFKILKQGRSYSTNFDHVIGQICANYLITVFLRNKVVNPPEEPCANYENPLQ
jgi:hypothetical protein